MICRKVVEGPRSGGPNCPGELSQLVQVVDVGGVQYQLISQLSKIGCLQHKSHASWNARVKQGYASAFGGLKSRGLAAHKHGTKHLLMER